MSILVNKDTRVLVQGITGREGMFHASQMLAYGTHVVAGVTPGKGGEWVLEGKVPVFDTAKRAVETT
jgi:succinyl-CoA synthetase alpha subunit